ncbi:SpvB/TcaC N-terminal domain-containing protein, partial [Crocosphaera sp.]|uniref:SpvB/TcaC N-terminal domain-containing protein n=1 Tax=Crocosphaera sp. TaxID=2729996 RepID=UPI00257C12B5
MDENKITATQVSLPKGGGAIQGIGETFQSNEFTGTASLSIPIATSPCRGFEPQLSVDYSSGAGNGIFGLGFGLSIPNISRKTSYRTPKYNESDTFLISNAEDLVPILDSEYQKNVDNKVYTIIKYRPRVEGLFALIEHWKSASGESFWCVISSDNVTSIYGKSENSRISDPDNPNRIFQWLLEASFDSKSNCILYEYKSENTDNIEQRISDNNRQQTANKYLSKIKYGNDKPIFVKDIYTILSNDNYLENQEQLETEKMQEIDWHFEVIFDYGEYNIELQHLNNNNSNPNHAIAECKNRKDPFSTYHAGFEIRTHRLCRNILMFHRFKELGQNPILVSSTSFEYHETPTVTLLKKVESIGYRYEKGEYKQKSLPEIEFDYTKFEPKKTENNNIIRPLFEPLIDESDRPLPGLNLPPNYQSIDLYGEGIPGVLYSDGASTLYWEPQGLTKGTNSGVSYAFPKTLLEFPIERSFAQGNQMLGPSASVEGNRMLMDLASDGRMALVVSRLGSSGYYQYNPDQDSWQGFQPFESFPTDFEHPQQQMVDMTGDGLTDILFVESDRLRVYPSLGEKGYGQPFMSPREHDLPMTKPGDAEEVLQFADMFGTGKQHLVRIRD